MRLPLHSVSMFPNIEVNETYMKDLLRNETTIIGSHDGILEKPQVT